jgi:hypothetical protein
MLLNDDWDLSLTESGNIAMTEGAYATAQNVANECRLFVRDAYFEMNKGIPHYIIELGFADNPDKSLLRTYLRRAAGRVSDVKEITNISFENMDKEHRKLAGIIEFTTMEGENVSLDI